MRTETITRTLYTFEELSETAKEAARIWFREDYPDHEWWESTYEDAERIGLKITSFGLDRNRHAKGRFITNALDCAQAVLKEHGETCETYKTASTFIADARELDHDFPGEDQESDKEAAMEGLENEFLKSILEDYSIMLQREYEYLLSDEHVDESIIINEYEFTENGKIA